MGIPVDKFTLKNDPYKIDFGYRDPRTNTYRMFDAVSLVTTLDRAKILALSWPKIHDGMGKQLAMPCEMYAIVENGQETEAAKTGWGWMEEVGIKVNPLSAVEALAADAKQALRLYLTECGG